MRGRAAHAACGLKRDKHHRRGRVAPRMRRVD